MKASLRKPLFWTNLIVLVLFGLAVSDVIFGWTNPSSDPPNPPGALRAVSDEIGLGTDPVTGNRLTISGILNMLDNEIQNVGWPTASSSAATRGYVLAQGGGGGTPEAGAITTVTLFGVSSTQTQVTDTNLWRGPNGGVPPGCHNNVGLCNWILQNLWGALRQGLISVIPPAGEGVPACTSLPTPSSGNWEWFQIMAGYGPHETVINSYAVGTVGGFTAQFPEALDPTSFTWQIDEIGGSLGNLNVQDVDVVSESVSITDSVCSYAIDENISITNNILGGQVSAGAGVNSACSPYKCNTCRICGLAKMP